MSKLEAISRYNIIINKLKRGAATFDEIKEKLKAEGELQERNFNISKRTFQRDVKEIFDLFKIEIVYDKSLRKYKAIPPNSEIIENRTLEVFDIFNALNISERISNYILFEDRKPQGTENFNLYLHAIKKRQCLRVKYQKFWDKKPTIREVMPYAVKEFKSRWYLVARDKKDDEIKTFGFDRILEVDLLREKFDNVEEELIQNKFRIFFGVITPDEEKPEEIILELGGFQGKYIETLPLHHSQKIIKKEKNLVQVSLFLVPTYDFVQELLSMQDKVRIIEPKSLQKTVKEIALNIAAQY